jgi:hypothetical protein
MCRELVIDLVDKAQGKVDEPTATKNDWEDVKQAGMKRKYEETCEDDKALHLRNYRLHLNSSGRGKGIAIYFKDTKFAVTQKIKEENHQISKMESKDFTVVALYRSHADRTLATQLKATISFAGSCLVIGDFNVCSKLNPSHEIFATLRSLGFNLLINEATHLKGGHLDQAWLRSSKESSLVQLYSPYYTCKDHDALLFSFYDPTTEQGTYFGEKQSLNINYFKGFKKIPGQPASTSHIEQGNPKVKLINICFAYAIKLPFFRESWICSN